MGNNKSKQRRSEANISLKMDITDSGRKGYPLADSPHEGDVFLGKLKVAFVILLKMASKKLPKVNKANN